MEDLKPCPHCGGSAEYFLDNWGGDRDIAAIKCRDCGIGIVHDYFCSERGNDVKEKPLVINIWNKRYVEPESVW